jgi:hypothetical protein
MKGLILFSLLLFLFSIYVHTVPCTVESRSSCSLSRMVAVVVVVGSAFRVPALLPQMLIDSRMLAGFLPGSGGLGVIIVWKKRGHDHGVRSHDHGVRSHDHGVRSHDHGVRSHDHGVRSHDHGVRSYDHDMKSHDHGVRSHHLQ